MSIFNSVIFRQVWRKYSPWAWTDHIQHRERDAILLQSLYSWAFPSSHSPYHSSRPQQKDVRPDCVRTWKLDRCCTSLHTSCLKQSSVPRLRFWAAALISCTILLRRTASFLLSTSYLFLEVRTFEESMQNLWQILEVPELCYCGSIASQSLGMFLMKPQSWWIKHLPITFPWYVIQPQSWWIKAWDACFDEDLI